MENLFMFLATSLVLRISSQKRSRYLIGSSGASCLLFTVAKKFSIKYTREGDRIYFNEYTDSKVTYGVICIDMKNLYNLGQAENILGQYINKIRKPFKISHNVSIEIKRKPALRSATDYWQDEAGKDWKITGYTNGKIVAVLYVKNITATTVKEHDAFLNGFKFSAPV